MKKSLFAVIVFCIMSITVTCYAASSDFVFTQPEGLVWETYVSDNTTGLYKTTNVDITTIIPMGIGQSRILGFSVMSLTGHGGVTGGSEAVASLWDEIAGTASPSIIDEAEAIDERISINWFPTPRIVTNGLTIRQGGNTRVIVYYE